MQPERTLAFGIALGVETPFTHVYRNVVHRVGQTVEQLLEMHLPVLVQHVCLVEHTVHIALELLIFVHLAVAELLNCLCKYSQQSRNQTQDLCRSLRSLPSVTLVFATQLSCTGASSFSNSGGGYCGIL